MADPFSWAAIGTAASIAGGATAAGGAIIGGQSQQAMYNYQSGVAQLNSKIALQNRDYTLQAGGSAGYQSGLKTADVVGLQKAGQSASGLDVNSGSSKDVRSSTTSLGQYDQSLIATNYAKKAYGYEVEAASQDAQAKADLIAGDNASTAGKISAASSILSTVGSVSGKWLQGSSAFGGGTDSSPIRLFDENQRVTGYA